MSVEVGWCVSGVRPDVVEPQTPSGGWLWWMVPGSSEAAQRSDVWAAIRWLGLIDSFLFSVLLWLSFGGGSLTAAEFRVLFQHYWLQADRYVKESHLILQQAAVKHTPTHTSSPECVCLPNTPGFPYRITDYNPNVRPGRKVSASMKLFIHQSPVHLCMYEFIDSDYWTILFWNYLWQAATQANPYAALCRTATTNESRQLIKAFSYDSK